MTRNERQKKSTWTEVSPAAIVAAIPSEARALFDELMAEAPRSVEALRGEVTSYMRVVAQAAVHRPHVGTRSAERLSLASYQLLSLLDDSTPPAARRVAQAAVRYFVVEHDGVSDLDQEGGFDDDVAVMNAALHAFGRGDWTIPVGERDARA